MKERPEETKTKNKTRKVIITQGKRKEEDNQGGD